jgi:predicted DNA-binding transcriptional regulator AlpA
MTTRIDVLRDLPWPRGLSLEEAATYTGVSPNTFLAEVKSGLWPAPERRGRRIIWDRSEIDAFWDHRKADVAANCNRADRAARWAGRSA